MNRENLIKYGRWILSLVLVVGVYSETGMFTALFAAVVLVAMEFQALISKALVDVVELLSEKP